MRIIITCGPSYAPIDEVRRITNFSTGELGSLLGDALADAGHETICLRGEASTHPVPPRRSRLVPFTTNDDLLARLHALARETGTHAIFHTAALADFEVASVAGADASAKISSAAPKLELTLVPARKIISELRALFPSARIVGWKYELAGTPDDAVSRAVRQIAANRTDACVVNGRAYGPGFGLVEGRAVTARFATKPDLCAGLVRWLAANKS